MCDFFVHFRGFAIHNRILGTPVSVTLAISRHNRAPPRSTLTMTNNKLEPDYGRPNQRMAKAVRDAQKLFQAQAPDEAIALLKQNDIPLPVVERVILRRGPSRRRAPPT